MTAAPTSETPKRPETPPQSARAPKTVRASKLGKGIDAPRALSLGAMLCSLAAMVAALLVWELEILVALPALLASLMSGGIFWRLSRHNPQRSLREAMMIEAFNAVLSPQLITDGEGRTVLANQAFTSWLSDLGPEGEEALAARLSARPQVAAEFRRLRQAVRAGQVAVAELPFSAHDDAEAGKPSEWRRIMARQLLGWPGYVHWRFEDITERRRVEQGMRDEQSRLLDFMMHAPVGIYSVDQDGRFRFVNRTLAEWLGCLPEDLTNSGARLHDVLAEPLAGTAPHAIAPGAEGQLRGDVMMKSRHGRLFPVSITQTVVQGADGKSLRTRSVVRDLAPERAWQEALTLSEHRFQRLFAQSPIGVVLLDAELRFVETNQAFIKLIGSSPADILGGSLPALLPPQQRAAIISNLRQILAGREQEKPIETALNTRAGELATHLYARGFSLQGEQTEHGPGAGLMVYVIDLSEQKRLESQFAQSQKMQAIGQLAGGIAHDFNNLLTAMLGFCDLLLQRHKPGDQSFADIMQIKQNASRAANLVRQLLAFSRQQALQPKVLNITDVLAELSNLLRRLIGANIELQMTHGRDLFSVRVDEGQLEQVIINLVVNARDAMPQGGRLQISTANLRLETALLRGQDEMPPGEYVVIEVADSGTGIPPEIMGRIFEPFFSTKEVGQGTGLGLSTVYGIVRQTGGYVGVDSKLGAGTKFAIYLPRHQEGAKPSVAAASPPEKPEDRTADLTGAAAILLVEDEDAVRVFSARALRNKGYTVIEARSGEEALQLLAGEARNVEVLISDVVMPQMDGPTLIRQVREKLPELKVIFISGYTEDRFRDQLRAGEVVHFLGKPFTLKQLATKVKDVLNNDTEAAGS